MLVCEGYKMFRGTAVIVPKNKKYDAFMLSGTWLYKPEYKCWYVNGSSYPEEIVQNIQEREE